MRKLMLGLSGLLLMGASVHAQSVEKELNSAPEVAVASSSKKTIYVVTGGNAVQVVQEQSNADDPMRSKTFSKSFSLSGGDKVSLSNRYGPVVIKTWDKKEIKVDVDIKAYSNKEDEAQTLLNEAEIEASKVGDQVSFSTRIGEGKNQSYGTSIRNGKTLWRREVKVSYVVYLPASSALTIANQYGPIEIGNHSGDISIKLQYGNLTAGKLSSNNNYISVQYGKTTVQEIGQAVIKQQYGSGVTIGTVNGNLELNAQYAAVTISAVKGNATIKQQYGSGLNVGAVENLDLNAQYANVTLGNVNGNAVIKQQYNSITIGNVNKLDIKGQYANVKVGNLKGDGNFKLSYNNLNIDNISNACKNLNVDGAYVGVNIGFASNYNAELDVSTRYGGFKYGSGVTARLIGDEDRNEKAYTGKIGNGSSGKVVIKTQYGGITFK